MMGMAKPKPLQSRWQKILDITLHPAAASLPPTVPSERRRVTERHALLHRIHGEFEGMPGVSLTLDQAAKLFGLRPEITSRILGQLTDARVLRHKSDGRFALRDEEL
jgi:hypothetical protein